MYGIMCMWKWGFDNYFFKVFLFGIVLEVFRFRKEGGGIFFL